VKEGRRSGVGAAGVHVNLQCCARLIEQIFVQSIMSGELEILEAAARDFDLEAADDFVDLRRLTAVIDRLDAKRCRVVAVATKRGDHLLTGKSATSWVASECQMSKTAAANRLCVGEQLAGMPKVAQALSSGDIGFQAASVICHLQQRVVEAGGYTDEAMWIENAGESSIKDLADVASSTWHAVDPTAFKAKVEEAHQRRQLCISECGDMYRLDGWLELTAGVAVKTAVESLCNRLGESDRRSPKQRRADALVEMAHHAMDQGTLPRRNGVRPHIAVHTTIEGLKGELGAPASELADGTSISSTTVQRLACDGTLHRILKADSMVIDVGRATRAISSPQRRGIKARYRTCAGPGCHRPVSSTSGHHVDFWTEGGHNNLRKILPVCYFQHRLVHEGEWQVVQFGQGYKFIPPERPVVSRRRWGERRWAA